MLGTIKRIDQEENIKDEVIQVDKVVATRFEDKINTMMNLIEKKVEDMMIRIDLKFKMIEGMFNRIEGMSIKFDKKVNEMMNKIDKKTNM